MKLRVSLILCIICCYLQIPLWANEGSRGNDWSQWTKNVWNGREYYYNTATGESQWEKPVDTQPVVASTTNQPISRLRNHRKFPSKRRTSTPTSANTAKPVQENFHLPLEKDVEIPQITEPSNNPNDHSINSASITSPPNVDSSSIKTNTTFNNEQYEDPLLISSTESMLPVLREKYNNFTEVAVLTTTASQKEDELSRMLSNRENEVAALREEMKCLKQTKNQKRKEFEHSKKKFSKQLEQLKSIQSKVIQTYQQEMEDLIQSTKHIQRPPQYTEQKHREMDSFKQEVLTHKVVHEEESDILPIRFLVGKTLNTAVSSFHTVAKNIHLSTIFSPSYWLKSRAKSYVLQKSQTSDETPIVTIRMKDITKTGKRYARSSVSDSIQKTKQVKEEEDHMYHGLLAEKDALQHQVTALTITTDEQRQFIDELEAYFKEQTSSIENESAVKQENLFSLQEKVDELQSHANVLLTEQQEWNQERSQLLDAFEQGAEVTRAKDAYMQDLEVLLSLCDQHTQCLHDFVVRVIPFLHLLYMKITEQQEPIPSMEVMRQYDELVDDYEHLSEQFQNVTKQLQYVLHSQASEKVDAYCQQFDISTDCCMQGNCKKDEITRSSPSSLSSSPTISKERVWWKFWTWFL